MYAGFAGFAAVQRRRAGDLAPCGCFGGEGATLTAWHIWLDLAAAGVAVAAAIWPPSWAGVHADPLVAATTAIGVAAAISLAYLAFTALPRAWSGPVTRSGRG